MKTLLEYIQKKHITNQQLELTIKDICDIFNGDLINTNEIAHCDVAECTFFDLDKNYLCDKELTLLIYFKNEYIAEKPDMMFIWWDGNVNTIKDCMNVFRNAVNQHREITWLPKAVYVDRKINFLVPTNDKTTIMLYTTDNYKNLEINYVY